MIEDILQYGRQMLPLGLIALIVLLLLRPLRKRRLARLNLVSSFRREAVLVLFVAFSAGLAALTLFPANFWSGTYYFLLHPNAWGTLLREWNPLSYYPTWEETVSQIPYLPNMLTPFEEISRALNRKSYWLLFMLLGNIIMFMPIGFFPALLWRKPRWWKSLLAGFGSSVTIEFIQFFIGRSTDIDDVILNTTGALAGFWVFCLLRAVFPNLMEKFQCQSRGGYYHG